MALLVEALKMYLNGIWSFLEVGELGVNLHHFDSIAVTRGIILANFSKLQGWRNIFNFKLSIKERLPSKILAILRFDVAVQPIKDVFAREFPPPSLQKSMMTTMSKSNIRRFGVVWWYSTLSSDK